MQGRRTRGPIVGLLALLSACHFDDRLVSVKSPAAATAAPVTTPVNVDSPLVRATCSENSPSVTTCACPDGLVADGFDCVAPDKRIAAASGCAPSQSAPAPCSGEVACADNANGFVCTCAPGNSFDGFACVADQPQVPDDSPVPCDFSPGAWVAPPTNVTVSTSAVGFTIAWRPIACAVAYIVTVKDLTAGSFNPGHYRTNAASSLLVDHWQAGHSYQFLVGADIVDDDSASGRQTRTSASASASIDSPSRYSYLYVIQGGTLYQVNPRTGKSEQWNFRNWTGASVMVQAFTDSADNPSPSTLVNTLTITQGSNLWSVNTLSTAETELGAAPVDAGATLEATGFSNESEFSIQNGHLYRSDFGVATPVDLGAGWDGAMTLTAMATAALGPKLYITQPDSLKSVDPATGAFTELGLGPWPASGTTTAASLDGSLYFIVAGTLYQVNATSNTWQRSAVSDTVWSGATLMAATY